ncbi:MAG: septal ring lytic transglycosylase RlpA family protein [Candidatus Dadabacteria bacterium]|nr:septal ring lytic transglycosylase RlpA family protein [Candidatus Dadabacteria bacterium]MDE0292095.1 septal ring lytic transglycosylase RlpA family protein [Candidatus Dadabacteria bacterium]MDE0476481.1 septal ring lytic transglycosylase RlpA family protein [Candidatus Dadabacteria bacterium]
MIWVRFAVLIAFFAVGCSFSSGSPKWESRDFQRPKSTHTVQYGKASWYGDKEHGKRSASGEVFNRNAYTAAHKELPFGTVVRVTNRENGRQVRVRINDRGPYIRGRVIDLSYAAAEAIGLVRSGVVEVKVEVLSTPSERSESLFVSLYTVQAGSFRSKAAANELKRKLSRVTDEDVRVESFAFEGDTYYRVRVGRFKKRKDAETLRVVLRKRGYSARIYVE